VKLIAQKAIDTIIAELYQEIWVGKHGSGLVEATLLLIAWGFTGS
jgi:hypothetical protein